MRYTQTSPCNNCPFRSDIDPYLGPERTEEILKGLLEQQATFTCHKGIGKPENEQFHCAGAMILLEHMERPNQMMRIMERLGEYDRRKLDMDSPVYVDADDMLDAYCEADLQHR